MSKMKHLLRKLHIGGGVTDPHHHPHHRPPPIDPPPFRESDSALTPPSSSSETTPSSSAALPRVGESNSVSASDSAPDFNYFEEEFQVQLALAISVSEPDSREDPETAQIKAAQQISLGCSPSETPRRISVASLLETLGQ